MRITLDELNRAMTKIWRDLPTPILNRMTPDEIERLIDHEILHERLLAILIW